ncbi:hypothetical protein V6N13_091297 [Hibiscus sabdariffa]|uniref:Uncharacterized protein n=1 Tax=Hibiscus sabdariffa TaxID=183260 RepID=A0ABR2BV61_9ROSI
MPRRHHLRSSLLQVCFRYLLHRPQLKNLSWIRSGGVSLSPLDRTSELSSHETESPTVYHRAIGNGLVEVPSVYRSAVVLQIEHKLLSETMPVLATVTQGLNNFFVILPPLYELVLKIERHDLRGGKLLNLLHKRLHCGVPELQACIQRQEDRDVEYGSFIPDTSEKLARLSADDKSSRDWLALWLSYIPGIFSCLLDRLVEEEEAIAGLLLKCTETFTKALGECRSSAFASRGTAEILIS